MIVDPWGVVLAQAQDAEGYVVAELDLERQARIRRELPALANRRPARLSLAGAGAARRAAAAGTRARRRRWLS